MQFELHYATKPTKYLDLPNLREVEHIAVQTLLTEGERVEIITPTGNKFCITKDSTAIHHTYNGFKFEN